MRVRKTKILLAAIGAGSLALVLMHSVLVLQITLPRSQNRVVYAGLGSAGDKLCMHYLHSVERTPVQGWFALDAQGGFRALQTKTTGTGTGLPNVVSKSRVRMQGKWMVVDEQKTYVPEIPFYYLPLNNLRIRVGGEKIDLDQVPAGSQMRITCTPKPLAQALVVLASSWLGA